MLDKIKIGFKTFGGCLFAIFILLLIFLVTPYLFERLWNWIMPYLFHLPTISLAMAYGILFFLAIIFGGIKKGW